MWRWIPHTHHIHLEILDSENRFGVFIQAEDGGENNISGILVLGYTVGVIITAVW